MYGLSMQTIHIINRMDADSDLYMKLRMMPD